MAAARKRSGGTKKVPLEYKYRELGARIRTARKALYMSGEELAAAADLTAGHVFAIERGSFRPRDRKLVKIARALEVTPEWLLTGKGEP